MRHGSNLAQKPKEKMRKRSIVRIHQRSDAAASGTLSYGNLRFPVALGRGVRYLKREGDGSTPLGYWRLLQVYYRRDRVRRPPGLFSCQPIHRCFGWCDDPDDRNYNRKVVMPYTASAERLWRNDHLYDIVVVMSYNVVPRIAGRGSAIFVHVARRNYAPTAGCIAMKREHLLTLLAALKQNAIIAAGKNVPALTGAASGSGKDRSPAFRARVSWRLSLPHGSSGQHGGARRR